MRKGDEPEPAYIVQLDEPTCASNLDDTGGQDVSTSTIRLFPAKVSDFRPYTGQHVTVVGSAIYVGPTAHYHAPLVMDVASMDLDGVGVPGEEPPAIAVVRAFYEALHEGTGDEAARFLLPGRRRGGLSPAAMTRFYSTLSEPLTVTSIRSLGQSDFEVHYSFRAGSNACAGHSIVSTVTYRGSNYISSIRSLSGC